MKGRRGFTLVELIVVIAVIAILATLATLGLSRYLAEGRDTRRAANVATVAEALEKYYDQNGEYPACDAITSDAANVAGNVLKGIDQSALATPGAGSPSPNSIKCGVPLSVSGNDFYEYVGDGSPDCNSNGSCLAFTLRYKSELDNTVKEVQSRRQQDIASSGKPVLTLDDVNITSVELSWTKVANASQYTVQRASNASFTSGLVQYPTSTTNYTINGLSSGTTYYFRVAAANGPHTGQWSDPVSDTTLTLGKPTINGSTMNSTTQLTLTWSSVAGATSYTIQRATNSAFTTGVVNTNGIVSTSNAQSGLTTGTLYYFRVQAVAGSVTSAWSNVYQGGTTQVPSGVAASGATCGGATVSWNASTGATSYQVQYSTSSSFTSPTTVTTSSTSVSPSGLPQNTTIYFRVYALLGQSKTAASSTASTLVSICSPANNTISCSGSSAANCTSNATCANGSLVNYEWKANGSVWVSGDSYKSVAYSVNYGQGVTLSLRTRCHIGSTYSAYATASPASYSYTRTVSAPTLYGLNLYSGRRVTTSWSNVCGGSYIMHLQQGSYATEPYPRASYNAGNPAAGSYEDPYSTSDNRVWYSGGVVYYQVRTVCNGVWSGWSNQQSRSI